MLRKNKHIKRKEIYIPIEIKAREFVSQLFLAGELANKDARVFLGAKSPMDQLINEKQNKSGTYLYKGGGSDVKKFRALSSRVSSIAVLDQEVSPAIKSYDYIKIRFVKGSLKYVSRLYYIGQEAAKAAKRLLNEIDPKNIKDTGWPRVDLWMPSKHNIWANEVNTIRKEFGDNFILFSSDFGINSQKLLDERLLRFQLVGAEKSKEQIKYNTERSEAAYQHFLQFIEFLNELDLDNRLPKIIVRPHPAEDHQIWIEKTSNLKNVKVVYRGDITAWLLASKGLLHRGCTTAIQATISNIKTGCLKDHIDSTNNSLAIKLSPMLGTVEDIVAWTKKDATGFNFEKMKNILSNHITFSEPSATDLVATDLINLAGEATIRSKIKNKSFLRKTLIRVYNKLKFIVSSNKKKKNPHNLGKLPKYNKMQDGIKEQEINDLITSMYPGRKFYIKQITDDLFVIEKNINC